MKKIISLFFVVILFVSLFLSYSITDSQADTCWVCKEYEEYDMCQGTWNEGHPNCGIHSSGDCYLTGYQCDLTPE